MALRLLVCFLGGFCILGPALSQDKAQMLGKTSAQIISMGREKWFKLYTAKFGDSTMAMGGADDVFATCLGNANDARINRLSAVAKARMKSLRPMMKGFANGAIGVGYERTGGGTIWNLVSNGSEARIEETIALILKRPASSTRWLRLASVVEAKLAKAELKIVEAKAAINSLQQNGFSTAQQCLADAQSQFRSLRAAAQELTPGQAETLMRFCVLTADFAANPFSEEGP